MKLFGFGKSGKSTQEAPAEQPEEQPEEQAHGRGEEQEGDWSTDQASRRAESPAEGTGEDFTEPAQSSGPSGSSEDHEQGGENEDVGRDEPQSESASLDEEGNLHVDAEGGNQQGTYDLDAGEEGSSKESGTAGLPDPDDVDDSVLEQIEKDRAERLHPDNRPENSEVDNTQRDFDAEEGRFVN